MDKGRTDKERGQFLEYYCDNVGECIKRNRSINKIRKELMRKKLQKFNELKEKKVR